MKKLSLLLLSAISAVSANAEVWKMTSADPIDQGEFIIDNDLVHVEFANNDANPTLIVAGEDKHADPVTYADNTFDYYVGVRVTDAPSAANPTGTEYANCVALVIDAVEKVDVTLYYKIGATKSIDCYDQSTGESVSITQIATNPGEDNLYCTGLYKFQEGHTYTVYAKGGTVQLHGISTAEGTYTPPTSFLYANASASAVDGYSTITYADGAQLVLLNSAKSWSGGSSITIDGKKYTSIKVSNGAQNKFVAPAGKQVYKAIFYSYVNKDAATDRAPYWKEVNGVEYTAETATIMQSYKNGANPDVNTYDMDGVTEFTFTNTGEQVCFVLEVSYTPSSAGLENIAVDNVTVKKVIKNGALVIETANGKFNAAGLFVK